MTIQSLTDDMMVNLIKSQHWYIERDTQWNRICPSASIPERRFNEFYRQPRGEPPGISATDSEAFYTATFMEKYVAPNAYVISDFDYPRAIIQLTESFGMPVVAQQSQSIFKQMAMRAGQIIYQGTAAIEPANTYGAPERGVDLGMKGLTNIASPAGLNGSTYDAVKWQAAFGPQNTFRDMAGTLEVDGMDAPFAAVLSNGCQTGLWYVITNTAETNWRGVHEVLSGTQSGPGDPKGGVLFFEDNGVESIYGSQIVYPLPAATSNDEVALLMKPSADHYQALIGVPPALDLGPMDTHGRTVPGKAVMQMGIIIPQPTAICYHPQVNFA